jgi:hypothetical protein
MEKQDLYIKEALKILKHNNSYFKKVYSASQVETYQISINSKEYYFFIELPEEDDDRDRRIFDDGINNIPNVRILNSYAGQIPPSGAEQIEGTDKIYDLQDDFDKITKIIDDLASSSSPDPEPEPEPTDIDDTDKSDTDKSDTDKSDTHKSDTEDKDYYIHQFKLRDRTKDARPKVVTTAVTDRNLDNYKLLVEFFGYIVDDAKTIHTDKNPQDLYQFVPNNALTPKNIKGAAGAIAKSFYIRLEWGPAENRQSKTFHSVPTYWDNPSVEKLLHDHLLAKLSPKDRTSFENLTYTVKESEDKSRHGSFDFNTIGPTMLSSVAKGLRVAQAYQIDCFDSEGDEHSFVTVKSTIPIDEYIQKLQRSGFNNITFNPVMRPGKIELDDINSSFSAIKENRNLFTRLFRRK